MEETGFKSDQTEWAGCRSRIGCLTRAIRFGFCDFCPRHGIDPVLTEDPGVGDKIGKNERCTGKSQEIRTFTSDSPKTNINKLIYRTGNQNEIWIKQAMMTEK